MTTTFPPTSAQSLANVAEALPQVLDRSIGDFIREIRQLDETQIERILSYQREHRVRFGEAAIALELANRDDVVWALSQQFHYPYAASEGVNLNEELVAAVEPFSEQSEAFREIRSQLMMGVLAPDQPRRALAVLSADVGDGKSYFAANLAITLSQLGGRTLLIDADMRTPRQHQLFGVANTSGLSGVLAGRVEDNVIHQMRDIPSMYVMPVSIVPPNPLELVQRPAFGLLLQGLLGKFDHIVVDTPAASQGADAHVIAAKCGAALVMGRRGKTKVKAIQGLLASLRKGRTAVAGVMMNEH